MDKLGKYGSIVILDADGQRKEYPPGMPIFVLLGQDELSVASVEAYADSLAAAASTALAEGLDGSARRLRQLEDKARAYALNMRAWQIEHPDFVKLPD